ncbi:MAG TPA: di-heme oxidoredictase family protein [Anaeromyxobacteraceae bacterium]|nr:di-heme oxidoredictase family protein [Anaeromyxobacteraceae bacterium]
MDVRNVVRLVCVVSSSLVSSAAPAAVDPGPRGGPPGAGDALPGLAAADQAFFTAGKEDFEAVSSVQGDAVVAGTEAGLGPRFNLDSCAGCHKHPAIGGSSPALNPQVALATLQGATNDVPWFVRANGPIREARFKFNPDGSRDGGVAAIFTITGRRDAPGCNLLQPDFGFPGNPNLIFRIPTPTFGAGLIEAINDATILANKRANGFAKAQLGISGKENRTGNDGTITRFGWKAQNKSLLIFSGEAYNVEQGVTNELFQQEREEDPACRFNKLTEDFSSFVADPEVTQSGVVKFAAFMRFLAAPTPAPDTPAIVAGRAQFSAVGCALCHTPTLTTGRHRIAALDRKPANLYSDLLVHDMGTGLADDIVQGAAGPREFRTAPLWGLGQRLFFLHDGRTRDLASAITAHNSPGSEANAVVLRYLLLPDRDKQDLLTFLRSL